MKGVIRLVRISRSLGWLLLISNTLVFLAQVLGGFDEPLEVVIGCGAAGLAAYLAVLLWVQRKHHRVGPKR